MDPPVARIVVFSVAWGPRNGGINSFNADLCIALRRVTGPDTEVVCVLVGPDVADAAQLARWEHEAAEHGIRLEALVIPANPSEPTLDLLAALRPKDVAGDLYVGHDIFTGPWAVAVARRLESKSIVIHHMSPRLYKSAQGVSGDEVQQTVQQQRRLFEDATFVGAVGPRLLGSARALLPAGAADKFFQLNPGLADILVGTPASTTFTGITIGRLGGRDDIVKQGRLAAQAFAQAVGNLENTAKGIDFVFMSIGLSSDDIAYHEQQEALRAELSARSVRFVALSGHRFSEDRENLFAEMRSCHVFYMLSLHDGFGMAGLEAIAAGVPLVLSCRTGLHDLLVKLELDDFVKVVSTDRMDMKSNVAEVADCTLEIFKERVEARSRAFELLRRLRDKDITWDGCARELLRVAGCSGLLSDPAARLQARPKNANVNTEWPWSGLRQDEERTLRRIVAWLISRDAMVAQVDGALVNGAVGERKARVIKRLIQLVRWEMPDLFRLHIERIPAGSVASVRERISHCLDELDVQPELERAQLLFIVDPPGDIEADPMSWIACVERGETSNAYILLTAPLGNHALVPPSTVTLPWTSLPGRRFARFGLAEGTDWSERAAAALVGSTVFGLSSDELFEALAEPPGNLSEDERYELLGRLGAGASTTMVRSELRWVVAGHQHERRGQAEHAIATQLAGMLEPSVDQAIAASHNQQWSALRSVLPSALEGIVQRIWAGEPGRAFSQFHQHLFAPVLYRFARYDWIIMTLRSLFTDATLEESYLVDTAHALEARLCVAQAFANLGRVTEAMRIYQAAIDSTATRPTRTLLLRAAFCSFLAAEYSRTEQLLRSAVASVEHEAELPAVHRSLGKLYLRELRLEEARDELAKARNGYTALNDRQGMVGLVTYEAELCLELGDVDGALRRIDEGMALLADTSAGRRDARDEVRLLLRRGSALLRTDRTQESGEAAHSAMAAALSIGAADFVVEAHVLAAQTALRCNLAYGRLSGLRLIAGQAERGGLRRHHGEALLAIAGIERVRGSIDEARRLARCARDASVLEGGTRRDAVLWRAAGRSLADEG